MISVYSIKPQFQRVLTPILELLHRAKVTANQITLWACILSLVIGIFVLVCGRCGYVALPLPACGTADTYGPECLRRNDGSPLQSNHPKGRAVKRSG